MYSNIEKKKLDVVQEDNRFQPNYIGVKPSSMKNILLNVNNITMAVENNLEKEDIKDKIKTKNNIEKVLLNETKTAELFLFNQDISMVEEGRKPINLNSKMFENVMKKQKLYIQNFDASVSKLNDSKESEEIAKVNDNIEISNESDKDEFEIDGLSSVFITLDDITNETPVEEVSQVESTEEPLPVEIEISDLSTDTTELINLINSEVQSENDLMTSKQQLEKVTSDLEEAKQIEQQEIVRKYELEEAIKIQTDRQRKMELEQSRIVNARIIELKKAKADIDMKIEEKTSELENTNTNITAIRNSNADLASIYNAMLNSYNPTNEEQEEYAKRVA